MELQKELINIWSQKNKMKNLKEKLCVWREVVNHDNDKLARGDKKVTFSRDNKCVSCDGYNTKCGDYAVLPKK